MSTVFIDLPPLFGYVALVSVNGLNVRTDQTRRDNPIRMLGVTWPMSIMLSDLKVSA